MKNDNALNQKIINITMLIHNNRPELSKYLSEMIATIPMDSNPKINDETLSNYLFSLESLLSKYELEVGKKEVSFT